MVKECLRCDWLGEPRAAGVRVATSRELDKEPTSRRGGARTILIGDGLSVVVMYRRWSLGASEFKRLRSLLVLHLSISIEART